MNLRTKTFLQLFKLTENKYKNSSKRLAGDTWPEPWQTLIATILSAQSRDEVTIPIAVNLFTAYPTLQDLSKADPKDVLKVIKRINYNKTKAEHSVEAAKYLLENHQGNIPETLEELKKIPGVGLKTANLVLGEVYSKDAICVDTHVHRISNIFNIVKTKTPEQTEQALRKIAPKEYWSKINRYFVLLGKDVPGKNREKFLEKLQGKES